MLLIGAFLGREVEISVLGSYITAPTSEKKPGIRKNSLKISDLVGISVKACDTMQDSM